MLTGPYLPLFDLEVEHAFFPDNRCVAALQFVLTEASAAALRHSGLLVRATESGVAVFTDASRPEALRLVADDAGEPFRLTWLAYATDPLFCNYTEGLVYPPAGLPFFDSDCAVADERPGCWRLQRGAEVSPDDALPLDDPAVQEALSGRAQHLPPLFAVTLRLDAASGGSPPGQKRHVLRFATRAAVWRYWLVGDWREPSLQIVDPDGRALFSQVEQGTLPDGRPAVAIRSDAPIGIFRRSPFRFQLRGRGGNGDRMLIRRLPVAGAAQFSRDPDVSGGALVSDIYVHR